MCLAFQEFLNHFRNSFSSCTWVTTKHRKCYLKTGQTVASFGSGGSRKRAELCPNHGGRTAEGICRRHLAFPSLTEQLLVASAFFCLDASSFSGKLGSGWARCIFSPSLSPTFHNSHTAGLAAVAVAAAARSIPSASRPAAPAYRLGCVRVPSCPLAALRAFPWVRELPPEFGPVTDIGYLYVLFSVEMLLKLSEHVSVDGSSWIKHWFGVGTC